MEDLRFEWDENKNRTNKKKHHISFEEAVGVFYDSEALLKRDDAHSIGEERFIILGISEKSGLLTVCHCYRESDAVIRIISARKATKSEAGQYYNSIRGE